MGKYRSLTIEERFMIEKLLNEGRTPNAIAKILERSPASITREIEHHKQTVKTNNDCLAYILKTCQKRNACGKCNLVKLCKYCIYKKCTEVCSDYIPAECDNLQSSPHVCNGCRDASKCKISKQYYKAMDAENIANAELHDKRAGFDYTEYEVKLIDKALSPLIQNGQTPYAALKAKGDYLKDKGISISKNTLYRLIDSGLLKCRNGDLPERVKRRKSKLHKRNRKETYAVLTIDKAGHLYGDYLKYIAKHDVSTVEMDCVEGRKSDSEALLTLHFKNVHMQIAVILDRQDAKNVVEALDKIENALGYELFCQMFPLILTDNGTEFTDIAGMERSCTVSGKQRTMIFFCEPNRSDQKGACERNHREMRKIIPKGTTLHPFMQQDITLMMNHVNSYVRESLCGKCPYDVAMSLYPEDFFILLGLEKIPPEQVIMNKHLFDYKKSS